MKTYIIAPLWPAIAFLCLFTLLLGIIYPAIVTFVLQFSFPDKANGSLIHIDNTLRGSTLIGQPFSEPQYFWSRPSATSPYYNSANSTGSNLSPTTSIFLDQLKSNIQNLQNSDPDNAMPIPIDLITASASGLDPHISIAAALYQVPRIAHHRNINESTLYALVTNITESRQWFVLGEPRVNVLKLNMALDNIPDQGQTSDGD